VLEGKLGLFFDQAAGHDQVPGHPFCALGFQRLDLVLGGAVQFLARDILVDLGGTFAVGAVGAAKITRIGYTGRTVFGAVPAELAGTGVTAVETAGCTVLAVAKGFTVVAASESAAVAFAFAAGTVSIRLVVTVTVRLALPAAAEGLTLSTAGTEAPAVAVAIAARTIAVRLVVTVTVRLPLPAAAKRLTLPPAGTEAPAVAFAFAARTVTIRLALPAAAERLTLTPAGESAAVAVAFAARTVTIRLVVTVTVRLPLTSAAEGLTLSPAGESAAVAVAFPARTVTIRLVITVAIGLAFAEGLAVIGPGRTLRSLRIPVIAGTESARFAAGIARPAEGAAVIAAAIAAVVLSHGDSSCCEPTTGAIAAARSVFRYPTQPEIKRFEVRTSQSILSEWRPAHDPDRPSGTGRGNVHISLADALAVDAGFRRTLSQLMRVSGGRSRS
jgi:hypothetical protein